MFCDARAFRLPVTLIVAVFSAALLVSAAFAVTSPTQTRESYVAQVEPICKRNTEANKRILAGVRKKIKQGKLGVAASQFAKASSAFGRAVREIRAVPQPPADAVKLEKWLVYLDKERKLLAEIGKALKSGAKTRAQRLSLQLTHNGNTANNKVLGFDFDYCLIESSRFS
jgi:hypothetical protein